MGDHIEVCTLEWPTFKDLDFVGDLQKAVVTNPSDTGYASAYPNLLTLLKKKWNIEHKDDDLIGIRVREVEGNSRSIQLNYGVFGFDHN